MRELLIDFITSLDGYASADGWPGWWGLEGPEYFAWLGEQPPVTYLMGANTYRVMSGFAGGETPAGTAEFRAEEEASVDELTRAPKVVFSASLEGWESAIATTSGSKLDSPSRTIASSDWDASITWHPAARLQYFTRGFFPGFPSLAGRIEKGTHMHITPWTFSHLYLYLSLAGFKDVTLHDVDEPKPRRVYEQLLGLFGSAYCASRLKKAGSDEERRFWTQAGSRQSIYGRRLVVSAVKR